MRQTVGLCTRSLIATWIAVACQLCVADHLLGPTLPAVRLPQQGAAVKGFTATIEVAKQDIAGYVPVEITITSTARFTADRRFVFRFEPLPGSQSPPRNGILVEVPMNASQGTKSTSVVRYLPKWSAGHGYQFFVSEGGQKLTDYEGSVGNVLRQGRRPQSDLLDLEFEYDRIVVDRDDQLATAGLPGNRQTFSTPARGLPPIRNGLSQAGSNTVDSLQAFGIGELPEDWRAYQRTDMVILSQQSLDRLRAQEAEFQALRQWVLGGGIVVGYDASSPEALANQLHFSWTDDEKSRGFVSSLAKDSIREGVSEDIFNRLAKLGAGFTLEPAPDREASDRDAEIQSRENATDKVWLQSVGAGFMIGFEKSESGPSQSDWRIADAAMGFRKSPMLRRGVDPLIGDRRFTEWMIPGVSQPPVYTFMGLLTAFVILVGPIAYRRTTRYGRGYLMFAIAPLLAMVTTLAMFGYGIVADGFGTIARVRQLTWIDGASGDAGERIRSTYFAGVRPGDGLRFSGNAEVIGYPNGIGTSWEELNEKSPALIGTVTLREDAQVFDSSFLPSRQQRQFVVHQPRPGMGVVRLNTTEGATPRLQSSLDFRMSKVIARDASGQYWTVDDLAAGESATCQPLTSQQASKALGQMYTVHRPVSEVREARQRNNYQNLTSDLIVNSNRIVGEVGRLVSNGSFEQWLVEHLQLGGELPRQYFIATAEVSDDVLAVTDVQLVDSIRYVFGTMP